MRKLKVLFSENMSYQQKLIEESLDSARKKVMKHSGNGLTV